MSFSVLVEGFLRFSVLLVSQLLQMQVSRRRSAITIMRILEAAQRKRAIKLTHASPSNFCPQFSLPSLASEDDTFRCDGRNTSLLFLTSWSTFISLPLVAHNVVEVLELPLSDLLENFHIFLLPQFSIKVLLTLQNRKHAAISPQSIIFFADLNNQQNYNSSICTPLSIRGIILPHHNYNYKNFYRTYLSLN